MIAGLILASLLAQGYYTPQEAQAVFKQANEAYDRGDHASAKQGYQQLLAHGFEGADLLFNLGTTCLAAGDLGEAVLYLERARRATGSTGDIDANLVLARSRQLDQVVGGAEEPFIQRLVVATSGEIAAWWLLVTWLGFFVLLLARRLLRPGRRAWAGGLAALLLVSSLPAGLLLAAHVYVRETVFEGVVIAKTLAARELPADSAKVSFEVHAGLKMRLLEVAGKFVKVRLPNGLEGWAERDGLAEI